MCGPKRQTNMRKWSCVSGSEEKHLCQVLLMKTKTWCWGICSVGALVDLESFCVGLRAKGWGRVHSRKTRKREIRVHAHRKSFQISLAVSGRKEMDLQPEWADPELADWENGTIFLMLLDEEPRETESWAMGRTEELLKCCLWADERRLRETPVSSRPKHSWSPWWAYAIVKSVTNGKLFPNLPAECLCSDKSSNMLEASSK